MPSAASKWPIAPCRTGGIASPRFAWKVVSLTQLCPHPAPGPSAGNWVELGCQQVSLFGKDRNSIRVGRREGRFKAIRLHVRGADVEMLDLKVIYANGQPDDIPVKHLIRAGERTRPLDLRGRERAIERVDMVYRTALNPGNILKQQGIGMANVCVEGLD